MGITVHLFASLAETAGTRHVQIEDVAVPTTAGLLGEAVLRRFPALRGMAGSIIYAVNAEYVSADYPVQSGDEVALIPPVSGGAAPPAFLVTPDPLDLETLFRLVLRASSGAVAHFVGVVRDNNLGRRVAYLEYDAYPAMATKLLQQIEAEVRERWEIDAIAMHHRTGRLEIGEASVAIAVSAPHRGEAIEACHYAIDRLKQIVPVWKKEVWVDGAHWVEGSLTPQAEALQRPRVRSGRG